MKLNVIVIACMLLGCMFTQGSVGLYIYVSDKDNLFLQVDKYDDLKNQKVKMALKTFIDSCKKNKEFRVRVKEGVQDKEWLRKDKSRWTVVKLNGDNWIFIEADALVQGLSYATRLEAILSYVKITRQHSTRGGRP